MLEKQLSLLSQLLIGFATGSLILRRRFILFLILTDLRYLVKELLDLRGTWLGERWVRAIECLRHELECNQSALRDLFLSQILLVLGYELLTDSLVSSLVVLTSYGLVQAAASVLDKDNEVNESKDAHKAHEAVAADCPRFRVADEVAKEHQTVHG